MGIKFLAAIVMVYILSSYAVYETSPLIPTGSKLDFLRYLTSFKAITFDWLPHPLNWVVSILFGLLLMVGIITTALELWDKLKV